MPQAKDLMGVDHRDQRVSHSFQWIAGVMSSIVVVLLVWVGSTLMGLSEKVAVLQVQTAPTLARVDKLDGKVDGMQTQLSRVESKVAIMEERQSQIIGRRQ